MFELISIIIIIYLIYLFVVYVVPPIIGIVIAVCLGTVVLIAGYGVISGFGLGIQNFYQIFVQAHRTVPQSVSPVRVLLRFYKVQPAYLIYAYDRGWRIMKYISQHVFIETEKNARTWFDRGKALSTKISTSDNIFAKIWLFSATIGTWLAGISQYLSALLFVALFTCLQFTLLTGWMLISSVMMLILGFLTWIYGAYYRIFCRCPDCYHQMKIPIYICPGCAREHTQLWPSIYGVFFHQCSGCDTKLPTLDIIKWGECQRVDLEQKCPYCQHPMNRDVGRLTNIHIPVVGGPSVGKSNYIMTATSKFVNRFTAKPFSYQISFPDPQHARIYQNNMRMLQSGQELEKTADIIPQAYNISIKDSSENKMGRIIYFYDPAGEAYSNQDQTTQQKYYKYVHGIIFMIDPFAIEACRAYYGNRLTKVGQSLRPSTLSIIEVYERMLAALEASVGLKRRVKFVHPIAVVLTKVDAFNLEAEVGWRAAQRLMKRNPVVRTEEDAISILVEKFLNRNNQDNLVRNLKAQFQNIKFFSCSSLGRMPNPTNTSSFKPIRTLEPLLWLLRQIGVVDLTEVHCNYIDKEHRKVTDSKSNIFARTKFYFWDSLRPYQ